ncbi:MAG: alpha/beta fold hydrolase [Planctomycetota bacterium]|jgi:proline iminopeptidase
MLETVPAESALVHVELAGSGPPIVLLHGGPGIYDYLSPAAFAARLGCAYTVVGYDQRGCRRSTSEGPFTVEANLADLEAVRGYLDAEELVLMGHSWGGLLAMFYAASFAQRVAKLVLVGSIGPRGGWERSFQETIERRHTAAQRSLLAHIDTDIGRSRDPTAREELCRRRFNVALPSYMAPDHRETPIEIESYTRRVNLETMADVDRSRYADSSWERGLVGLGGKVTIIHGRQDPVPWSVVDDTQGLVPQAKVIALEGCGHFPWLETPDRFDAALDQALGRVL